MSSKNAQKQKGGSSPKSMFNNEEVDNLKKVFDQIAGNTGK